VEDIFSQTDKSVAGQGVNYPIRPGEASQMPINNYGAGNLFGGRSLMSNRLIVIAVAVLVLILLSVAGWLAFTSFSKPTVKKTPVNQIANANVNTNTNANTNVSNVNTNVNTNVAPPPPQPDLSDLDSDGLIDTEEKTLGTDLYNFDTDSDGLSDYQEVKIYKTDPLNPDTDGDGFKDGQEVVNGYDPLLPGNAHLFGSSTAQNNNQPEPMINPLTLDSDKDGLTDVEERQLGTNSNGSDTDGDGLSDYQEVKIYKTNPLNPDTDGDTYTDGAEVLAGYDPNKPGNARLPASFPAYLSLPTSTRLMK